MQRQSAVHKSMQAQAHAGPVNASYILELHSLKLCLSLWKTIDACTLTGSVCWTEQTAHRRAQDSAQPLLLQPPRAPAASSASCQAKSCARSSSARPSSSNSMRCRMLSGTARRRCVKLARAPAGERAHVCQAKVFRGLQDAVRHSAAPLHEAREGAWWGICNYVLGGLHYAQASASSASLLPQSRLPAAEPPIVPTHTQHPGAPAHLRACSP